MNLLLTAGLSAGLLLSTMPQFGPASLPSETLPDDPQAVAEAWLTLVDESDFEATWEEAATDFKAQVTQEQWEAQMTQARVPAGDAQSREFLSTEAMTDPPGAPAGEYAQVRFRTTFSVAGEATEVVFLVEDGDRGWRVTGYFVQP